MRERVVHSGLFFTVSEVDLKARVPKRLRLSPQVRPIKEADVSSTALRLRDLLFAYSTMDNLEDDEMSLMRKQQSLFKSPRSFLGRPHVARNLTVMSPEISSGLIHKEIELNKASSMCQ